MNMMPTGQPMAIAIDVTNEAPEDLTRIGEMAKAFGVTLRTLRFYEDKGLLKPIRDGATRLYTRRDKARLKLILLGRKIGFSLRDVKQMMDLYDPSGTNARQLRVTLDKSEKQLARLNKQRQLLDEAIGDLQQLLATVREKLADQGAASN
jgi:DNA-binding transcriptional MerR regulator